MWPASFAQGQATPEQIEELQQTIEKLEAQAKAIREAELAAGEKRTGAWAKSIERMAVSAKSLVDRMGVEVRKKAAERETDAADTKKARAAAVAKAIPKDLLALKPSAFQPQKKWRGDHRFVDVDARPISETWGDWCEGDGGRLFIDGGRFRGKDHRGQPWKGWSEYYFKDVVFDGLQWSTESNAGTKRGALIGVTFRNVREDAIRDVAGHIEDVTIESAQLYPGSHGDTIDWKQPVDGAYIHNLVSVTGVLNGIIATDVKNIVIDGYVHLGDKDHLSIDFGGTAENVIIRNCKLSGGIRFRGKQTNVQIDWDTVQTNLPPEAFR